MINKDKLYIVYEHISPSNKKYIISRSSCGWATYDIREAIRRAKEEKANESK